MQSKPLPYTAETLKEVRAANLPKLQAIAAIVKTAIQKGA